MANLIPTIFALLIIYQLKHFVADYMLQSDYMLGKFKPGWDFIKPLLAHVGVHASFTWIIAWTFTNSYKASFLLAIGDGLIHFFMDRIKAGPKYLGRFKALSGTEYVECKKVIEKTYNYYEEETARVKLRNNSYFWLSLGFDQMIHHLTHYGCIYFILKAMHLI